MVDHDRAHTHKGNYKTRKDRECLYANEENDSDEQALSASDDEIGFVTIMFPVIGWKEILLDNL